MSYISNLTDILAVAISGVYKGQSVYICSTLDDGMCVCNVGQDEFGEIRYAEIHKSELRPARAKPAIREHLYDHSKSPKYDWTLVHKFLTSPR